MASTVIDNDACLDVTVSSVCTNDSSMDWLLADEEGRYVTDTEGNLIIVKTLNI